MECKPAGRRWCGQGLHVEDPSRADTRSLKYRPQSAPGRIRTAAPPPGARCSISFVVRVTSFFGITVAGASAAGVRAGVHGRFARRPAPPGRRSSATLFLSKHPGLWNLPSSSQGTREMRRAKGLELPAPSWAQAQRRRGRTAPPRLGDVPARGEARAGLGPPLTPGRFPRKKPVTCPGSDRPAGL
jgi:hypothetical protein